MLEAAVQLGRSVATQTVVVGPARPDLELAGVLVVTEDEPFLGPLSGVVAALDAIESPTLVILAVDQPFVSSTLLRQLISESRASGRPVCFQVGEQIATFPCAAPADRLDLHIREAWAAGERSLLSVLRDCDLGTVPASSALARELRDIDAPADLEEPDYVTDG